MQTLSTYQLSIVVGGYPANTPAFSENYIKTMIDDANFDASRTSIPFSLVLGAGATFFHSPLLGGIVFASALLPLWVHQKAFNASPSLNWNL